MICQIVHDMQVRGLVVFGCVCVCVCVGGLFFGGF